MAITHTFYGPFQVEMLVADLDSRITIQGSDRSDGMYEVARHSHGGFPQLIEGNAWSISIEVSPLFGTKQYAAKELFLYETHSPTEGFVTQLQTVKPHIPVPGETVNLQYVFRTALRLVYLDEKLKPRTPALPLNFIYNPKVTRAVEAKHGTTNRPEGKPF